MRAVLRNEWTIFAIAMVTGILTGILTFARANAVLAFLLVFDKIMLQNLPKNTLRIGVFAVTLISQNSIISAIALGTLATVVGHATEQLGNYMGPGATGVVQAGLITVVQSALVGSILANSLLVMGLAFLFGGWKNGTQRFHSERPRAIVILMVLAVSALVVPTIAHTIHTPASAHEETLSIASALVLLVVFIASIPFSLQGGPIGEDIPATEFEEQPWSLTRAISVLAIAGISTAFVSDWFVQALEPTIESWSISQAFAGLVIVAIAGNAVENTVGIRLAVSNKVDYAISIVMNSSLQIALALTPILVLLSYFFTPVALTLVLPPLLVVSLALTAILSALIVYDGESNWLEGLALVGLYVMIAISFWWG